MGNPGTSRTTTANCTPPLDEDRPEALYPAHPKGRNPPPHSGRSLRPRNFLKAASPHRQLRRSE